MCSSKIVARLLIVAQIANSNQDSSKIPLDGSKIATRSKIANSSKMWWSSSSDSSKMWWSSSSDSGKSSSSDVVE